MRLLKQGVQDVILEKFILPISILKSIQYYPSLSLLILSGLLSNTKFEGVVEARGLRGNVDGWLFLTLF